MASSTPGRAGHLVTGDWSARWAAYRLLPSVEEYVLLAQHGPLIEVFRRPADADAVWLSESAISGGAVTIHGAVLTVDALYGP
jgi:hypothetical protein